jgi:type IV secretory pathway TrbD component
MGNSANDIWIIVIVAVFGLVIWLTSMAAAARGQARDGRGLKRVIRAARCDERRLRPGR